SLATVIAPVTSYADIHVAPLSSYIYTVSAVDGAYNESIKSAPATTATPACMCLVTIVTSASPTSGGNTSGGGTINCGTSVTVTATASAGYSFVNWTENGTAVGTSANY